MHLLWALVYNKLQHLNLERDVMDTVTMHLLVPVRVVYLPKTVKYRRKFSLVLPLKGLNH